MTDELAALLCTARLAVIEAKASAEAHLRILEQESPELARQAVETVGRANLWRLWATPMFVALADQVAEIDGQRATIATVPEQSERSEEL